MSNKTRKHIWPVSLVMSIAIIGALAAFLVLATNPGDTQAHGAGDHPNQGWPACADMVPGDRAIHDAAHANLTIHGTNAPCSATPSTPSTPAGPAKTASDSSSGSGSPEIQLTINSLPSNMSVGSSIVLYLEDDFAEPSSILASSVYIVATPASETTGNGARVYVTSPAKIKTGAYFDADKKDISIRVLVPDMCTNATDKCEGPNGLMMDQKVTVVFESDSGIKNPSEARSPGYHTGYALLGATEGIPSKVTADGMPVDGKPRGRMLDDLVVYRKITLADVDNKRGYEQTVTGSGFKDGTTADVHVLHIMGTEPGNAMRNAYLWNALNCDEMIAAVPSDAAGNMGTGMNNPYCAMYNDDFPDAQKAVVNALDFSKGAPEAQLCAAIIRDGTEVGGALVGSDDKVAVTFEVTAPTFGPGQTNHICMADGTGNPSSTDVEDFKLDPSIKVVPATVNSGDTVNVFAQDFSNTRASHTLLKIANRMIDDSFITDDESISIGGDGSVTFEVPGGFEGTLRIDAQWGPLNDAGKCVAGEGCISKDSKITIGGAELNSSKTKVLPNETITINGNGFGTQTCIDQEDITLDSVPVMVHNDSLSDCTDDMGTNDTSDDRSFRGVEVSNSGQFVTTIILWPAERNAATNPTLIAGTHNLEVVDTADYEAVISLTIAQPSIKVTPDIAGPRDYITVTGENWAVDNLDHSLSDPITVVVEDFQSGRTYPVYADSVGRFTIEHRVHRNVAIPDTVQVKANYDQGRVVQIGSFAVPASTITVTPGEGQPGDTVTLTSGNMPVYTEVDYVEIGGTTYNDPGVNTDRDGNVTIEDVLIPGLDPGVYSVVINVDGTIAIGEVNVLAESSARGAPAMLPGAVESLGDNLVAIFHFDDVGKEWSFYDPRPEFADLNTLTEMVNGEAYWILVSETVEDVVLNNKVRSLTCRGSDCWNLEVW